MQEANRVPSTPTTDMPARHSRRSFLANAAGVAAGSAVLALAPALPGSASAAVAPSGRAMTDVFPAMRSAAAALDEASKRFVEANTAFHEIMADLEQWDRDHPEPRRLAARRKWFAWMEKVHAKSGIFEAEAEKNAARQALYHAMRDVADVLPVDIEQLGVKSALAVVYEHETIHRKMPIISQAVVMDSIRIAGMI